MDAHSSKFLRKNYEKCQKFFIFLCFPKNQCSVQTPNALDFLNETEISHKSEHGFIFR